MLAPSLVSEVPLSEIKLDPNQPRRIKNDEVVRDLAESIRIHGLVNPIEIDEKGYIVTGETRYRAFKYLGRTTIPAKRITRDDNTLARQLTENLARAEMNPLDIARGVIQLKRENPGLENPAIAKLLGTTQHMVTSYLHAFDVEPEITRAVEQGKLDFMVLDALRKTPVEVRSKLFNLALQKKFAAKHLDVLHRYLNRTRDFDVIDTIVDKGLTTDQLQEILDERNPSHATTMLKGSNVNRRVINAAGNLTVALATTKFEELKRDQLHSIAFALSGVLNEIEKLAPTLEKLKIDLKDKMYAGPRP